MNNKLQVLKQDCETEIKRKTTPISKEIEQIKQEIKDLNEDTLKKLTILANKKHSADEQLSIQQENEKALNNLIEAIQAAEDALKAETAGITAAIEAVKHYSDYLHNPNHPDSIKNVVDSCTRSVELLTNDIKNKGFGGRILSAIQGLLLAMAGFIVTILVVIPCVLLTSKSMDPRQPKGFDTPLFALKIFQTAYDCSAEAWTGKIKPRELKVLDQKLKELIQKVDTASDMPGNKSSFFTSLEDATSKDKKNPDQNVVKGQNP